MPGHMNKGSIDSVVFSDGTSGTALTYSAQYIGEVGWTNGGRQLSDLMHTNGTFANTAPAQGDEQPSSITLSNLKLVSRGNDSAIALLDIINQTGVYASTWVSTTDAAGNCQNGEKTFNTAITMTDCSGSAAQPYHWARCTIDPASVVFNSEGAITSLTITSRQPYPSTTAPTNV